MMYKILSVLLMMASVATAGNLRNGFSDKFEQWVKDFRINIHDNSHKEHLFVNWVENDKIIDTTNARNLTYTLGHNHLSGMDSNEFSEYMGFQNNANTLGSHISIDKIKVRLAEVKCLKKCIDDYESSNKLSTVTCVTDCLQTRAGLSMNNLPESVDWVNGGAVTPVKNQGQCGSCWSFSTTGALEGAYYTTYGSLPSFSEQQLVDCDTRKNGGKDMGCNGGLMDNAFAWIEKNGGLCSEGDYPYTSGDTKTAGTCESTCDIVSNSVVTSFNDVHSSNDVDMMTALSKQPVSIAIEADQKDFQLYSSGVFTGSCGTNLDHGVLAVGYGSLDGQDFYKVKNSWGTTWGDGGYILLGRGDEFNKGQGQCGMLLQASYPEV
jgi:C1A family cysteine protease